MTYASHQFVGQPDPVLSAIQATAEIDRWIESHPDIAWAEHCPVGNYNRFRVWIVRDGEEYEGAGSAMRFAYQMADRKVPRPRRQPDLNPAARDVFASLVDGFGGAVKQFGRMERG